MPSLILVIPVICFISAVASFNETMSGSGVCDEPAQALIHSCAQDLRQMGIFTGGGAQELAFKDIRSRTQKYFIQMCDSYKKYTECVGGHTAKEVCYANEPFKSRYSVIDVALEYVCGEAYEEMLDNWDCYLRVASKDEISRCESTFVQLATRQEAMYNEYSVGNGACFALQTYIDCIRQAIESDCGERSFSHVVEAIERPVHVYLPHCTLTSKAPVLALSILTSIISFLVYEY